MKTTMPDKKEITMKYIANCNHDKRAIREIEAERAKKSPAREIWGESGSKS